MNTQETESPAHNNVQIDNSWQRREVSWFGRLLMKCFRKHFRKYSRTILFHAYERGKIDSRQLHAMDAISLRLIDQHNEQLKP